MRNIYTVWEMIAKEHRLDPWRTHLSASEIIETMRCKGFKVTNSMKPYFAREFNRRHNHDGKILFKTSAIRNIEQYVQTVMAINI